MYFLKYKITPIQRSSHLKNLGKGFALCWIDSLSQKEAEYKSRNNIVESGWNIMELEEAYPISLEEIDSKHPSFNCYLQAKENGEYILFVTSSPSTAIDGEG